MRKKLTQEEFIEKAKEVHGDKYDLSEVIFCGIKKPIKVICYKHGAWYPRASSFLDGHGCQKCSAERTASKKRKTNSENIADFIKKHGDKYDYSEWNTKKTTELGAIICHNKDMFGAEHGKFYMAAHNHKAGHGCPKCAGKEKLTDKIFIDRAQLKHGNRYDYSLVKIIGDEYSKIKIICNKCGNTFEQSVTAHLQGEGCPKCKFSKLEKNVENTLKKYNIIFNCQQTFPWLKSNKDWPMFLDFYIPEQNIAIECQGIQHYEARGKIFNEEKVRTIKQRDNLKFKLCQRYGIPIYYVKYNDNVEKKLNEIFRKISIS